MNRQKITYAFVIVAVGILLSLYAVAAGRYGGLTEIFNKAARNSDVSGSFNRASGSATLPDKGQLTYDFNKAARPPNTNYNSPQPTLTPNGGPPNNAPNF